MSTKTKKEPIEARPLVGLETWSDVEVEIIVRGPYCWGRGKSVKAAKKNAQANKPSHVRSPRYEGFIVPAGADEDGNSLAYVDGLGSVNFRRNLPAFSLGEV